MSKTTSLGILAYGSLIDDPGLEIKVKIACRISDVETPFKVEFARSSSSRDGAPTLIPVCAGGRKVRGTILLLKDCVTSKEGENLIWRREVGKIGSSEIYKKVTKSSLNKVIVKELQNFSGVDCVLYTEIGSNIQGVTPESLAKHAINSAKQKAGELGKDGISYLISARKNGIVTKLSEPYEKAILHKTGQDNLIEAQAYVRRISKL